MRLLPTGSLLWKGAHWQDYSLRLESTTQQRSAHYDRIDSKPTTTLVAASRLLMSGRLLQFSKGRRVEPKYLLRGGVKLQTASTTFGSPPYSSATTKLPLFAQVQKKGKQGPCTTMTTMITIRGRRRRRQDKETMTTRVATTSVCVCHRMCYNDHYHVEEEERLTTTTGEMMAQGEGSHNDTTTRMTAMTTVMKDRIQERSKDKRTTTSLLGVVRLLTDWLRLMLLAFFSHFQRFSEGFLRV